MNSLCFLCLLCVFCVTAITQSDTNLPATDREVTEVHKGVTKHTK